MTPEQRKAARERCGAATSGPWMRGMGYAVRQIYALDPNGKLIAVIVDTSAGLTEANANATFIARARTDLPAALDALDRLEADRADLLAACVEAVETIKLLAEREWTPEKTSEGLNQRSVSKSLHKQADRLQSVVAKAKAGTP